MSQREADEERHAVRSGPPVDPTVSPRPLIVREGRVLAYRQLDVADEIDLAACQDLMRATASRRNALTREGAQSLVFSAPPLEIVLGPQSVRLPRTGVDIQAEVSARLFDYGAVSFSFDVPIPPGASSGRSSRYATSSTTRPSSSTRRGRSCSRSSRDWAPRSVAPTTGTRSRRTRSSSCAGSTAIRARPTCSPLGPWRASSWGSPRSRRLSRAPARRRPGARVQLFRRRSRRGRLERRLRAGALR